MTFKSLPQPLVVNNKTIIMSAQEAEKRDGTSEALRDDNARDARQEDMEAAAEFVMTLDSSHKNQVNESGTGPSAENGPQYSPMPLQESNETEQIRSLAKIPKCSHSIVDTSKVSLDKSARGRGQSVPTPEMRDSGDDIELAEQGLQRFNQHVMAPLEPLEQVQHGAFYEDGRNAREVIVTEDGMSCTSPADSNTQIVEVSANVVDPEEENRRVQQKVEQVLSELQQNTEVAEVVTGFWCNPRTLWNVAGLVLAVIILATVLGFVFKPEAPSPLTHLTDLISSVSLDGGEKLRIPSTPQYKALHWLAENAKLDEYSDKQKIQRYALATFFYSTSGMDWHNRYGWLDDGDECGWFNDHGELFCRNRVVVNLDLFETRTQTGNNLVGTIPDEITLLSDSLERISLGENGLIGRLPSAISLLTNLNDLSLAGNSLTGTIPTELGVMSNLTECKLHHNDFVGTVPSEIVLLSSLELLHMYHNELAGNFTCPDSIDSCLISCGDEDDDACRSL